METYDSMTRRINPPISSLPIVDMLHQSNHATYFVGECVRDSIMGRTPKYWDIATDATPDVVMALANERSLRVIPTGLKHGTVTIIVGNDSYKVTTFRIDHPSSDHRHPDSVSFTSDITEDLKRRDFTINAIAYNPILEYFLDPFDGRKDIYSRIIRCVGNPYNRIREDALRILRALRFSATLGFRIEDSINKHDATTLSAAMGNERDLLRMISKERISSELSKILTVPITPGEESILIPLLSRFFGILLVIIPELYPTYRFNQNSQWHQFWLHEHLIRTVGNCQSQQLSTRLAALLHDIGKPYMFQEEMDGTRHFKGHAFISADIAEKVLKSLRFDNDTIKKTIILINYHDERSSLNPKSIRRQLSRIGDPDLMRELFDLQKADDIARSSAVSSSFDRERHLEILDDILRDKEAFKVKDLAVDGNDMICIGFKKGPIIGRILDHLLRMVIDQEINNDHDELLEEAWRVLMNEE